MATDKTIAKPSDVCCLKGTIHQGEPRGSTTTVAGVETYVVEPPKDKANGNILLYFPDVWGFFNNGYLIMDGFADAGYLVLGLDYFRGVCFPSNCSLVLGIPLTSGEGPRLEAPQASQ